MTISEYIDSIVDEIIDEMVEAFPNEKDSILGSRSVINFIATRSASWTIQFLQESLNERRINSSAEETKMDESN